MNNSIREVLRERLMVRAAIAKCYGHIPSLDAIYYRSKGIWHIKISSQELFGDIIVPHLWSEQLGLLNVM